MSNFHHDGYTHYFYDVAGTKTTNRVEKMLLITIVSGWYQTIV